MGEQDKIHYFIKGLAPKTRAETGYLNPSSLQEAINVASNYEKHFFGEKTNGVIQDVVPMDVNYANSDRRRSHTTNSNKQFEKKNVYQKNHVSVEVKHKKKMDKSKIKCFNCDNNGHYAKDCWKPKKSYKNKNENAHTSFIGNKNLLNTYGYIGTHKMNVVFDTGATKSIMSYNAVQKFNLKIVPTKQMVSIADGSQAKAIGATEILAVEVHGTICDICFTILTLQDIDVLLGLDWFKYTNAIIDPTNFILKFPSKEVNLKDAVSVFAEEEKHDECMVVDNPLADEEDIEGDETWENHVDKNSTMKVKNEWLTESEVQNFQEFINSYLDVFAFSYDDLGTCTVGKHAIHTTVEKPIYMRPYRRSLKEAKEIEEEVKAMLEAKIIRPSKSPWSFPVLMVPKKDGSRRFCIDYRALNKVTVKDAFPIPRIDDILDKSKDGFWFSGLDLKSGYWQVALEPDSIPKTAFSTNTGHYEFVKMPFGLTNAPQDFCRAMMIFCGDLKFLVVYFDDFYVISKNYEEHIDHLKIVFDRFRK